MYDVDATELILKLAEELKNVEAIKPPTWAAFVKTGISKQRPPADREWWYARAASILRFVAARGPIGVQKLRVKYGSKKNRGVAAEHFYKGAGNNIRKILQQLESAELIKKAEAAGHKGRVLAPKGASLLNKVSKSIAKARPIQNKETVIEEIAKPEEHAEKKHAPKENVPESHELAKKNKEAKNG